MSHDSVDWDMINLGCPKCKSPAAGPPLFGRLQWHDLSFWCLRCGLAMNWADWHDRKCGGHPAVSPGTVS